MSEDSQLDPSLESMGASLKRSLSIAIHRIELAAARGLKGQEIAEFEALSRIFKTLSLHEPEPADPAARRAWLERKAKG